MRTAMDAPLAEPEQLVMVRDAARSLLAKEWPSADAVALGRDPAALRRLWSLAAGQGWTAVSVDDEELGLDAAVVVLQELGRAACPLPVMDAALANAALADSDDTVA